jgi:hypothetical protein
MTFNAYGRAVITMPCAAILGFADIVAHMRTATWLARRRELRLARGRAQSQDLVLTHQG